MKKKPGEESEGTSFNASHGLFHRFKARTNVHSINVSSEAADANIPAAREFPEMLQAIINEGMYLPKQDFNMDETGLYWKRMPGQGYISKEENAIKQQRVG